MDREEILAWLFGKLEEAEEAGEIDLEDLDHGESGVTVDTADGSFLISVKEM